VKVFTFVDMNETIDLNIKISTYEKRMLDYLSKERNELPKDVASKNDEIRLAIKNIADELPRKLV